MIKSVLKKNKIRDRRIIRVRKKIIGTIDKPRLCVTKSNKHIYAQLIDDHSGKTLFSISTLSKMIKSMNDSTACSKSKKSAAILGAIVGDYIFRNDIKSVCFDKRWAKFHGILKDFADNVKAKSNIF